MVKYFGGIGDDAVGSDGSETTLGVGSSTETVTVEQSTGVVWALASSAPEI